MKTTYLVVVQLNGNETPIKCEARPRIITEGMNRIVAVPYIVSMPEKDALLMLVTCDYPHHPMLMTSIDEGERWTEPREVFLDERGQPELGVGTALTYLGAGTVMMHTGGHGHRISHDYGETWEETLPLPPASNGKPWGEWDPLLVDRDPKTGTIERLLSFCSDNMQPDGHFQGYIRSSRDEGLTWSPDIKVPEMRAVNEAAFIRTRGGDIVAACRTDNPDRFAGELDHYGGLAVSISRDDGNTWSALNTLFHWGRHHACMALAENGDIVMTHVVRKGYTCTPDGRPRFGIEAVVSHDDGRSWDLDHRYILAVWEGNRKGADGWWASSQATSTVLMPDGSLLTAFGTGYRSQPDANGMPCPRDVGLVRWRLNAESINSDSTVRDAPYDSDLRNIFDPVLMAPFPRTLEGRVAGKKLRTIFNSDTTNIAISLDGKNATPSDYRRVLGSLLDLGPGVLAQNVGMPDFVNYRSKVATLFSAHMNEVIPLVWTDPAVRETYRRYADVVNRLHQAGTDVLQLTVETCHERGVPVLASYRMNSEDYYDKTYLLSDIGRAHPEWRISGTGCLDPAVPDVYRYRMQIFREAAENYDIDGIEFDFRRWYHMVSDPERNHVILTRMVRETRKMLDETAKRKDRARLILGARVGPSLDTDPNPFVFPGEYYPEDPMNSSCRKLGLEVRTWISDGLVDYVCPTTFIGPLPGLPRTREFVELAKGTEVGIYPTLWSASAWMHGINERWVTLSKEDEKALALLKHDLCSAALSMYRDGADGISTFNWFSHLRDANVPHNWSDRSNASAGAVDGSFTADGSDALQSHIYPLLGDRQALAEYSMQPWALPPLGIPGYGPCLNAPAFQRGPD